MKTMDSLKAERDEAEARVGVLEAALNELIGAMWSCHWCGPHPLSTARWCEMGCGPDSIMRRGASPGWKRMKAIAALAGDDE